MGATQAPARCDEVRSAGGRQKPVSRCGPRAAAWLEQARAVRGARIPDNFGRCFGHRGSHDVRNAEIVNWGKRAYSYRATIFFLFAGRISLHRWRRWQWQLPRQKGESPCSRLFGRRVSRRSPRRRQLAFVEKLHRQYGDAQPRAGSRGPRGAPRKDLDRRWPAGVPARDAGKTRERKIWPHRAEAEDMLDRRSEITGGGGGGGGVLRGGGGGRGGGGRRGRAWGGGGGAGGGARPIARW